MTTKHSPGPWRFGYDCDGEPWIYGPDATHVVCSANGSDADTALILLAPELADALRAVFEHCAMVHKRWGDGSNAKQADAAVAAARAVLAKLEPAPTFA
jgi:hypothetical protein